MNDQWTLSLCAETLSWPMAILDEMFMENCAHSYLTSTFVQLVLILDFRAQSSDPIPAYLVSAQWQQEYSGETFYTYYHMKTLPIYTALCSNGKGFEQHPYPLSCACLAWLQRSARVESELRPWSISNVPQMGTSQMEIRRIWGSSTSSTSSICFHAILHE